jgi:hypothetical protein
MLINYRRNIINILIKIKQKPFESILIIIYMVAFFIVIVFKDTWVDFLSLIPGDVCRDIIRLLFIIPYCVLVIPIMFSSILDSENVKKCYYCGIHVAYLLLPVALIWQNTDLGKIWILVIILLVSLFMAYSIYQKIKYKNKEKINRLKYSNLIVSTAFTIFCLLLDSASDKINTNILLFSVSLLLMLQVVYEKIDLEKTRNGDTGKGA